MIHKLINDGRLNVGFFGCDMENVVMRIRGVLRCNCANAEL